MNRHKLARLLNKATERANAGDGEAAEKMFRTCADAATGELRDKALFNLGALYQFRAGKQPDRARLAATYAEAVKCYAEVIGSESTDLELKSKALNNHGLIMGALGFPEKAKIAFHAALQLNPDLRAARLNFADILVFDGDYEEADRQFFEIINSNPESAGAQFSRGMVLLLFGELKRGFREYQARFRVPSFPSKIMATDRPLWTGEPLDGKTIILTAEQGWGDFIMFIRYAGEIKRCWPTARVF